MKSKASSCFDGWIATPHTWNFCSQFHCCCLQHRWWVDAMITESEIAQFPINVITNLQNFFLRQSFVWRGDTHIHISRLESRSSLTSNWMNVILAKVIHHLIAVIREHKNDWNNRIVKKTHKLTNFYTRTLTFDDTGLHRKCCQL